MDMDTYFMGEALKIAKYATGRTTPNPLVGAVIVNDNRIMGQGWHRKAGSPHAEIHALNQAGEFSKGATIYVTLEPCSHQGRTGPCADALIEAGIKRAVIAMADPNPLIAGKGIERLQAAGIEVRTGVLSDKAAKMNQIFIKWITSGLPFIAIKTAMSLDGKIAAHTGHSKWITAAPARNFGHTLRDNYDGILVGIGTVLADDPELTTRLADNRLGKNAVRIIVDSQARTPLSAKIVTNNPAQTIIAVTENAPEEQVELLKNKGVAVLPVKNNKNFFSGVDLRELLKILAGRGLTSILVEGGSGINASLLEANLVDKVYWFIAPKIIGGKNAPGPVGGAGVQTATEAIELEDIEIEHIGEDILVSANIFRREGRDVYRACRGNGQD